MKFQDRGVQSIRMETW